MRQKPEQEQAIAGHTSAFAAPLSVIVHGAIEKQGLKLRNVEESRK